MNFTKVFYETGLFVYFMLMIYIIATFKTNNAIPFGTIEYFLSSLAIAMMAIAYWTFLSAENNNDHYVVSLIYKLLYIATLVASLRWTYNIIDDKALPERITEVIIIFTTPLITGVCIGLFVIITGLIKLFSPSFYQ